MIDLATMRGLVDALSPSTRLLLLGDRHQLASVEAGSVLAELGQVFESKERKLRGCGAIELAKTYRFDETSGIYALCQCVRDGDQAGASKVLRGSWADLRFVVSAPPVDPMLGLWPVVRQNWAQALKSASPGEAMRQLNRFRILCAHRAGERGAASLNQRVRAWLAQEGLVAAAGEYYRGRLVMVTENDYPQRLYNGDVGLCWPGPGGQILVYFAGSGAGVESGAGAASGELRGLSPGQLPAHETAFCQTIHKSQGSEYDEVAIVLPAAHSRLLSRELLYTAVSRARQRAHLFAEPNAIQTAVSRSLGRASGLADALRRRLLTKH